VKQRATGRTVGLDDIAPRAAGAATGKTAGQNPLERAVAGVRRAMVEQPGAWVWRYLLAFLAAEVGGLLLGRGAGSALYAVLCFALINHHLALVLPWGPDTGARAALARPAVLLVLAVLAVSRLGSVSTAAFDPAWYGGYAVATIPLAAGLSYLYRTQLVTWPHLGRLDISAAGIAALGVPIAAVAFAATLPRPELGHWDMGPVVYLGVALFALGGAGEELLYRGLLQPLFGSLLGTSGIAATSLLYAATHGDLDAGTLVVLVAANIAFGQFARRTGSLTGVCIAHAVLNVFLALVLPYGWPH
jgi:membrane protease YdiL (CAAX protease family)